MGSNSNAIGKNNGKLSFSEKLTKKNYFVGCICPYIDEDFIIVLMAIIQSR
jgi:hypothetical protein